LSKSNEPIWWSLFSAGGVIAALFLPVLILLTCIGLPFAESADQIFDYERILSLASHRIGRLFLLVVIALPFFHAAHRLRYVVADLGLEKLGPLLSVVCYGSAIIGTILTIIVVIISL